MSANEATNEVKVIVALPEGMPPRSKAKITGSIREIAPFDDVIVTDIRAYTAAGRDVVSRINDPIVLLVTRGKPVVLQWRTEALKVIEKQFRQKMTMRVGNQVVLMRKDGVPRTTTRYKILKMEDGMAWLQSLGKKRYMKQNPVEKSKLRLYRHSSKTSTKPRSAP